jgi:hypothetical protein
MDPEAEAALDNVIAFDEHAEPPPREYLENADRPAVSLSATAG